MSSIRKVAVLGAGTMGAQLAAHFANAGVKSLLLDLTRDVARDGLRRAQRLKPDPFFTQQTSSAIETGGFDRDLPRAAEADWIIEAVVERVDVKRTLLGRLEGIRRPDAIVSSNTSGIPLVALSEGLSADFRRHWLGTHFFNPPRYLPLLEIIATGETDPAVVERVSAFAAMTLGKGVVLAKDTPNFIANRIGLFGMFEVLRALESGEYSIEEIDAMTGPAIGRPKSASFRTADLAGLDILRDVALNLADRLPDDPNRESFRLPALIDTLVDRGWIGEKAGRGFYKRVDGAPSPAGNAGGETEILTLDPATLSYRKREPARLPSLDSARTVEGAGARIKMLFHAQDKVGAFLRRTLGATLVYAARVAPDIAYSIDDVDRAMKWGFGWELGPFETWDAIGVREVLAAAGDCGPLPALVDELLQQGRNRFREGALPPQGPRLQILKSAKDRQRTVRSNPGATLVDIGDGVLAIEFHSKMNTIGGDTLQMILAGIQEATARFRALVVGNDAPNFSAGANLMLLLLEAQEGNWDEIDMMSRAFQSATRALRLAEVPVVACPAGLTLGGGCEIVLHAARVQAAAETYAGLVEAGVGLIPAAGGTKEMLARSVESQASTDDLLPAVQRVFETIGFAKVSTSAEHARELGYLRSVDAWTMNREQSMADAKTVALDLADRGYRPVPPRTSIAVGGDDVRAALNLGVHLAWRAGRITDHEALIGRTLAHVLAGGSVAHRTLVDEQYLLDLEREAFLKLCGERKTLERIQHTLKTGKTLRN